MAMPAKIETCDDSTDGRFTVDLREDGADLLLQRLREVHETPCVGKAAKPTRVWPSAPGAAKS